MSFWFITTHFALPAALWVLGIISVIICWRTARRIRLALLRRTWTCVDLPSPDESGMLHRVMAWFGQHHRRYALLSVVSAVTVSGLLAACWIVIN
ncbi:MAG: hypothetical protein ACYDCO_13365 [Armatimonadota bacterium]